MLPILIMKTTFYRQFYNFSLLDVNCLRSHFLFAFLQVITCAKVIPIKEKWHLKKVSIHGNSDHSGHHKISSRKFRFLFSNFSVPLSTSDIRAKVTSVQNCRSAIMTCFLFWDCYFLSLFNTMYQKFCTRWPSSVLSLLITKFILFENLVQCPSKILV